MENTKRTYVMSWYVYGNIWKNHHDQIEDIMRHEVTTKSIKLVDGKFDLDHDNNLIDVAKIVLRLTDIEHDMLVAKCTYFKGKIQTEQLQKNFQNTRKTLDIHPSDEDILELIKINEEISILLNKQQEKGEK